MPGASTAQGRGGCSGAPARAPRYSLCRDPAVLGQVLEPGIPQGAVQELLLPPGRAEAGGQDVGLSAGAHGCRCVWAAAGGEAGAINNACGGAPRMKGRAHVRGVGVSTPSRAHGAGIDSSIPASASGWARPPRPGRHATALGPLGATAPRRRRTPARPPPRRRPAEWPTGPQIRACGRAQPKQDLPLISPSHRWLQVPGPRTLVRGVGGVRGGPAAALAGPAAGRRRMPRPWPQAAVGPQATKSSPHRQFQSAACSGPCILQHSGSEPNSVRGRPSPSLGPGCKVGWAKDLLADGPIPAHQAAPLSLTATRASAAQLGTPHHGVPALTDRPAPTSRGKGCTGCLALVRVEHLVQAWTRLWGVFEHCSCCPTAQRSSRLHCAALFHFRSYTSSTHRPPGWPQAADITGSSATKGTQLPMCGPFAKPSAM